MGKDSIPLLKPLVSGVKNGYVTDYTQIKDAGMSDILYDDLVALAGNRQLVPGHRYRITDFMTTCNDLWLDGITEIRSAYHRFDIIVTALDKSTLDESAKAVRHEWARIPEDIPASNESLGILNLTMQFIEREGNHFLQSNINDWELKYSLNNPHAWNTDIKAKNVIQADIMFLTISGVTAQWRCAYFRRTKEQFKYDGKTFDRWELLYADSPYTDIVFGIDSDTTLDVDAGPRLDVFYKAAYYNTVSYRPLTVSSRILNIHGYKGTIYYMKRLSNNKKLGSFFFL